MHEGPHRLNGCGLTWGIGARHLRGSFWLSHPWRGTCPSRRLVATKNATQARARSGQPWIDAICLLLESDIGALDAYALFLDTATESRADPNAVDGFLVALASNWRHAATTPLVGRNRHLQQRRHYSAETTVQWIATRMANR